MRRKFNRLMSMLIAVTIAFSIMPTSFAETASFPDFPTGWSKPAMEAAVANGLISGYDDGTVRPKGNLTRAEMATIITKAFGATTVEDISRFRDVAEGSWYYDSVARAVKMGAISGRSNTEMAPNAQITRQEVFSILARVLVLSKEDTSSLNKFGDAGKIAAWAAPSMAALTERGYVNGDDKGNANPTAYITREEFAQLMYMAIRTYITKSGTYTKDLEGITVIRVPDVTIKGVKNSSDLVIGDGVGEGKVTIDNVTVEKRLLARGGSIKLNKTTLGEMVVVNNVNGTTYFDNYKDEEVFAGIVENTVAKFKERGGGGGGGGGGGTGTPTPSPSPSPSPATQFTLSFATNNVNAPLNFIPGFTPTTTFPLDATTITLPTSDKVSVPLGYRFNGWKTSETGNSIVTEITVSTGLATSITVTADFEVIQYPVTYKNQADNSDVSFVGGYTAPSVYTIEAPVTALPDATKVTAALGYKLKEWVDVNGDPVTAISVTASTTSAGMTVYAVYEPITYNVEYYEPNSTTPVTFVAGYTVPYTYDITNIPALPNLNQVVAPAGKELAEWQDENGDPVTALSVTATTPATLKLYAVWQDAPITKYIVHFADSNNDPVTFVSGQEPQTEYPAATTSVITLPDVSTVVVPLGYTFNGWLYNGNSATSITITNTTPAHINVIADITLKTYNVTFKNRDGSAITYAGLYQPPTVFDVNNTPALPTAAQVVAPAGYVLSGWEDVAGNPVTSLTVTATTPQNLELYPVYDVKTYTLSFVESDGTTPIQFNAGYTAPSQFTVLTAAGIVLPTGSDMVAPLGKIFSKWLDANGQEVTAITVTATTHDTVVLKASYTNKQYNVVYDTGAGSFISGYQPPLTFDVDNHVTFPTAEKMVAPLGYEFVYWINSAGNRADGWQVTPTTPDTVYVYAVYEPKTYNVVYYEPDGTTPVTFIAGYAVPYTYDITAIPALPTTDEVVAPAGKELDKWLDANGQEVTALSVTAATPDTLNLYATWKDEAITEYIVHYGDSNGNPVTFVTGQEPQTTFPAATTTVITLPAAGTVVPPVGYTFNEWQYGGVAATEITITATTPKHINVVAALNVKTYNVTFKNRDNSSITYEGLYQPPTVFDVNNTPALPAANQVVAPTGYVLSGWEDVDGNAVTSLTVTATTPDNLVLYPVYEEKLYGLQFKNPDGTDAVAVTGYTFPTSFNLSNVATVALPTKEQVVAPEHYELKEWQDANGNVVTSLSIDATTPDSLVLYAVLQPEKYIVEYKYQDTDLGIGEVDFVDGYTPKYEWYNHEVKIILPEADKVIEPTGYNFLGWTYTMSATPFSLRNTTRYITEITIDESLLPFITVKAVFEEKVYRVSFTNANFNTTVETEFTISSPLTLPSGDKVAPEPGYKFVKWLVNGAETTTVQVTATTPDVVNVTAEYELKVYPVTFLNSDGTAVQYIDGYTAPVSFTAESNTALPTYLNVKAPVGQELKRWVDAAGNTVTSPLTVTATTPDTGLVLYAVYDEISYRIEYYLNATTPVTFVSGYTAPTEYTKDNAASIVLPAASNIDLSATSFTTFVEWRTDLTDASTKVDRLTVTADTPKVLKLYAYCDTEYNVYFFEGLTDDDSYLLGTSPVDDEGHTVAFPDTTNFGQMGYTESKELASVYENNEYTHTVAATWWYFDDSNEFVEFTDETVVTKDTNVYLMNKRFSMLLVFESSNTPILASAAINNETRVLDSAKDLFESGKGQFEMALSMGMMPSYYDTAKDKIVDKLVDFKLIEVDGNDKNIQIMNVPFKISTFVKEDVANGMIKQYLRDVVKNPAELDKIFDMIDVAEFADQLGIDAIISEMTDAEIASIIKSSEHKQAIVDYIYTDLQKTNSSMLSFVIDYVINDSGFRGKLIDDLIAELKDKQAESTLKTEAIKYIKSQIDNPESAFYGKFVDMVAKDLKSTNSVVLDAVVSFVRTNLAADTEQGATLRKEILTSSMLKDFLEDSKMKAKVIDLILTDAFIDKALNNVEFRTVLVESVIDDEDFIDTLLASTEFHDYIVEQLHPGAGHALADDVKNLIADTDSDFRNYVLNLVKNNSAFTMLFTDHPELKTVVLNEIEWSDFVADDEDLLKCVFQQAGVTGSYSFITRADVEAAIATEYNARPEAALTGNYETLDASQKQNVRDTLYANTDARLAVINRVKTKFNEYKAGIVDKIAAGKVSEITDAKALELIDELLVDYITKYINKETLHTDAEINASIATTIENILFGFISDLIHNNGDLDGDGVLDTGIETEISTMIGHIDDIKHQFVIDPSPAVIARLKTVVKSYRDTHVANINGVVVNNYSDFVDKLITLVDPANPNTVYSDVETVLKSVAGTIDGSLISGYITGITDSDLKSLIKRYMKNITVADINTYIAAFLTSIDNENTVRGELATFITDPTLRATVESFAKTYISDEENESIIRTKISEFIDDVDEDFVEDNRAVIETALKGLDLSAFVDEQFVKDYVAGLTPEGKTAFADKIFAGLQANTDYSKFMKQLLNNETVEVNKSNLSMVTAISGAVRALTFDSVISNIVKNEALNRLMETAGADFVKKYYDTMITDYCDGLDAVIAEVSAAADANYKKSYTTSLTLRVNAIELLKKMYDKAQPKVVEKLENANIYYNENIYLKYLVEHDIIGSMLNGDESLASGDFTGYSLKGVEDYLDYLMALFFVADDALTWYGDEANITEAEFDALYDAMVGKAMLVQERLDEILRAFREDGELPSKLESVVEKVSQINSLITRFEPQINKVIDKYFASGITADKVANNDKVQTGIDIMIGADDPVFTIDMIYDIFYRFDDNMQAKLQKLIDSGKLEKALEKFESTDFAELLNKNSYAKKLGDIIEEVKATGKVNSAFERVYDLLVLVAEEGIEPFKVAEKEMVDEGGVYSYTEESYKISVGDISLTLSRYYQAPSWIMY